VKVEYPGLVQSKTMSSREQQSLQSARPPHKEATIIGIGRAVGTSHVPNPDFVKAPHEIGRRANDLAMRVAALEEQGFVLVDGSNECMREWEEIVGEFRILSTYHRTQPVVGRDGVFVCAK
jgi:hypothetical protein